MNNNRMKIVIFDTETTGLPKSLEPADKSPNNWPHLVSISWVVLENTLTHAISKQRSYIIKPQNWTIPEDSIKIHKITNEIAMKEGLSLKDVMEEFIAENPTHLIAHHMEFDLNVLIHAIKWDLGLDIYKKLHGCNLFCTMHISRPYCLLPTKYKNIYKSPKLQELYEFIFKRSPNTKKLHGSLYDTTILVECIQHAQWLQKELGLNKSSLYTINELHQEE